MKLGLFLTIHLNILSFLGGLGFIMVLRGNWIGGVILLIDGVYGNIVGRVISKKINAMIFSVTKMLGFLKN